LFEGQAGLGAVPGNEIVHGEAIGTLGIKRKEGIQDGGLGVVQIGKAKDSSRVTQLLLVGAFALHG
jgi:hypothetical protein